MTHNAASSLVMNAAMLSVLISEDEDMLPLREILPRWCEIHAVRHTSGGWTIRPEDGAASSPLSAISNRSIILLYGSDENAGGAHALRDVAGRLNTLNPHCIVSVVLGSHTKLLMSALNSFHNVHLDTSNELKNCHKSLFSINRELERNNIVVGELRNKLNMLRLAPPVMTSFAGSEDGFDVPWEANGQDVSIEQALHCGSYDFCGFDIFIGDARNRSGSIRCQLLDLGSLEVVATWRAELANLREGWVKFVLREALVSSGLTLGIRILLTDPLSKLGGVALGMARPRIHPPCLLNGRVLEDRTLAIRTWQGFVDRSVGGVAPLPSNHAQVEFEYTLPPGVIYGAQLGKSYDVSYPYFAVRADGTVLLHPVRSKVTSARIPNAVPSSSASVSAEVVVTGNAASPVDFALALVRDAPDPTAVGPLVDGATGCFATTEWITVHEPNASHIIDLPLASVTQDASDLYLFTRVSGDRSVNHCNAKFTKFHVKVQSQAVF